MVGYIFLLFSKDDNLHYGDKTTSKCLDILRSISIQ